MSLRVPQSHHQGRINSRRDGQSVQLPCVKGDVLNGRGHASVEALLPCGLLRRHLQFRQHFLCLFQHRFSLRCPRLISILHRVPDAELDPLILSIIAVCHDMQPQQNSRTHGQRSLCVIPLRPANDLRDHHQHRHPPKHPIPPFTPRMPKGVDEYAREGTFL